MHAVLHYTRDRCADAMPPAQFVSQHGNFNFHRTGSRRGSVRYTACRKLREEDERAIQPAMMAAHMPIMPSASAPLALSVFEKGL